MSRREARERALTLLYEAETRGMDPRDLLAEQPVVPDPFVVDVVGKVAAATGELDELIAAHLRRDWTIDRIPLIDRLCLRVGVAELRDTDTPVGVVISEAVELAKRYSTDESGRFVNGVLAALARDLRATSG